MKLTKGEVLYLVNGYVGVMGNSVGFPFQIDRTGLERFYPIYCDIQDFKPSEMSGTIEERFVQIFIEASPRNQAKIVRGIFKLWSPENNKRELQKREDIRKDYLKKAEALEATPLVDSETFSDDIHVIEAIESARILIKERGAQHAIDRVHTALHGYLRKLCTDAAIVLNGSEEVVTLFKYLREQHPSFFKNGREQDVVKKILFSCASIFDAINILRNHWSPAHPNALLQEADASLAIDTTLAVMRYLSIIVRS